MPPCRGVRSFPSGDTFGQRFHSCGDWYKCSTGRPRNATAVPKRGHQSMTYFVVPTSLRFCRQSASRLIQPTIRLPRQAQPDERSLLVVVRNKSLEGGSLHVPDEQEMSWGQSSIRSFFLRQLYSLSRSQSTCWVSGLSFGTITRSLIAVRIRGAHKESGPWLLQPRPARNSWWRRGGSRVLPSATRTASPDFRPARASPTNRPQACLLNGSALHRVRSSAARKESGPRLQ